MDVIDGLPRMIQDLQVAVQMLNTKVSAIDEEVSFTQISSLQGWDVN